MKRMVKGVVAVAITSSMLLSMTACGDKAGEQVIAAADDYAKAMIDGDVDTLEEMSDGMDDDFKSTLADNYQVDAETYGEDYEKICNAITDTISYEVDEESVDASTKDEEGSVDVVFTMVDYTKIAEDEDAMSDVDTFVSALSDKDADTKEITVTIEFNLDDEDWLVSNFDDILQATEEDSVLYYYQDYYEYYYSADGNVDNASLVYSATINPTVYTDGSFYECSYTCDPMPTGTYYVLGYDSESMDQLLFTTSFTVGA